VIHKLTSSALKQVAGGSVTFTATITSTASSITRNVTFYEGAKQIGQAAVGGGNAQINNAGTKKRRYVVVNGIHLRLLIDTLCTPPSSDS
jgi:hypothetical protein